MSSLRTAISLQMTKPVPGLDEVAARILSAEHDVEHRGRPRSHCPRCQDEGAAVVRRTRTVVAIDRPPKKRGPKPRQLEWLDGLRERPGVWVLVARRKTPEIARTVATRWRKRRIPDLEIRSKGREVWARVRVGLEGAG